MPADVLLIDTNVLVHAFRRDTAQHARYHAWLEDLAAGDAPFAVPDVVFSGFLRIVTHPRVFTQPSALAEAVEFADLLRDAPGCVVLAPGPRHWRLFTTLCQRVKARGNLIPDAWLAALAIEWGCELATADRGFAQFPGLKWSDPLEAG